MRGYVGNTCAFVQGDGGKVLSSLPPCVDDVVSNFVIAFTGSDEEIKGPSMKKLLGVTLGQFREAYDFLINHNHVYEHVRWDPEAAEDLAREGALGLPSQLAACVYRQPQSRGVQQTRQAG